MLSGMQNLESFQIFFSYIYIENTQAKMLDDIGIFFNSYEEYVNSHSYKNTIEKTVNNFDIYGLGFTLKYALSDALVSQIDYYSQSSTPTASSVSSFDRTMTRWGLGYKYATGSIVSAQYYTNERTDLSTTLATVNTYRITGDTSPTSAANTGSAKNSGYILNLNHDFGNQFTAVAMYSRGNNITTGQTSAELADSGAVGYTLGGLYRLSKRTHVYASANTIQNGINSNANLSGGGLAAGTVSFGATVSITNIGIQHNF
jgi:hypothetical protein